MRIKKQKHTIGRKDIIDLPDLQLFDLPCKIDTGAKTSALHAHSVKLIEKDGEKFVSFKLLDPSHEYYEGKEFLVKDFVEKRIKNSFGQAQLRYVIKTKVCIFGKEIETFFSLSNRKKMRFPILLGRRVLFRNFVVDVGKSNLSYKLKIAKKEGE